MPDDELERWIDQQEQLPDQLQEWYIFERPQWIWLGKLVMHAGFFKLGQRICGLRFETSTERVERLRRCWKEHQ